MLLKNFHAMMESMSLQLFHDSNLPHRPCRRLSRAKRQPEPVLDHNNQQSYR